MKRTIASTLTALALTVGLAFACIAGCANKSEQVKQTATAYLNQAGNAIISTIRRTRKAYLLLQWASRLMKMCITIT